MEFCSNCDMMLYLRIQRDDPNRLTYFCRYCGHQPTDIQQKSCVIVDTCYSSGMSEAVSDSMAPSAAIEQFINPYTVYDFTLPRVPAGEMVCPNEQCPSSSNHNATHNRHHHPEILSIRYDDNNLKYLYLCAECRFVWTH